KDGTVTIVMGEEGLEPVGVDPADLPIEKEPTEEPDEGRFPLVAAEEGWLDVAPLLDWERDLVFGAWEKKNNFLIPDAQEKSRFAVPLRPEANYELAFEFEMAKGVMPLSLNLPLVDRQMSFLLGALEPEEEGGEPRPFFLLTEAGKRGFTPDREQIELSLKLPHSLSIQVFHRPREFAVAVLLDGEEVKRWVQPRSKEFRYDEDISEIRQIALTAEGRVQIRDLRIRSLPEGDWLPPVRRPFVAEKGKSKGDGEGLRKGSKGKGQSEVSNPRMQVPESMEVDVPADVVAMESFLAGVEEMYEELIRRSVGVEVQKGLDELKEAYERKVVEAIASPTLSISEKAGFQRELIRLQDGVPLESTDPEGMPEAVKTYRESLRAKIEETNLEGKKGSLPTYQEYLTALRTDLPLPPSGGEWSEMAQNLWRDAEEKLRARIMDMEAELAETLEAGELGSDDPPSSASVMEESDGEEATLVLPRFSYPRQREEFRGSVTAWPRQEGIEMGEGWSDFPSGLTGNSSALVGSSELVAVLKSNGRVALWGGRLPPVLLEEVEETDRVVQVALRSEPATMIGLLLEDGTTKIIPSLSTVPMAEGMSESSEAEDVVEVALVAEGMVSLRADGRLKLPSRLESQMGTALPSGISRIYSHSRLLVGLGEDGAVQKFGKGVFFPQVDQLRKVAFGTQEEMGVVAETGSGKVVVDGVFGLWAEEVSSLGAEEVVALTAGFNAFGVRLKESGWHFFGTDLDPDLAEKAKDCVEVAIGRKHIIGLCED
ncbi:MAG: hypothetical protein AAGJ31_01520, partial [Verrucomicrobiota bacterium]